MSPSPLEQHLRTVPHGRLDWEVGLTIETLGRLAQLGRVEAVSILRGYVSAGTQWDYALHQLAELPDPQAVEGLPDIICARFKTGRELDDALAYNLNATPAVYTLWRRWEATHHCIADLLGEVREIEAANRLAYPRPVEPGYESLSIEELLAANSRHFIVVADAVEAKARPQDKGALVAGFSQSSPFAWYAALRGLQALGEAQPFYGRILEQAISSIEALPEGTDPHIPRRRALDLTLMLLPPEITLPLARQWFNSANWHKDLIAGHLLERHATPHDLPMVRQALSQHIEADPENVNSYAACSMLDILCRFPRIGPIAEVEGVFLETCYSLARFRAARTMQINAPAWFAYTYASECLWDCQEEVRQTGCESVPLSDGSVVERLRSTAQDQFESDTIREAATKCIH